MTATAILWYMPPLH